LPWGHNLFLPRLKASERRLAYAQAAWLSHAADNPDLTLGGELLRAFRGSEAMRNRQLRRRGFFAQWKHATRAR
jgi:hypothetical protein